MKHQRQRSQEQFLSMLLNPILNKQHKSPPNFQLAGPNGYRR